MKHAPPMSITVPAPKTSAVDTWKHAWPALRQQLPQFQHHYDGGGKQKRVGSLDEDVVFMALVIDIAKKQLTKEVVHHRRQRQPKAAKFSSSIVMKAADVSFHVLIVFNPYLFVICRSENASPSTLQTVPDKFHTALGPRPASTTRLHLRLPSRLHLRLQMQLRL